MQKPSKFIKEYEAARVRNIDRMRRRALEYDKEAIRPSQAAHKSAMSFAKFHIAEWPIYWITFDKLTEE